MSRVGQIAEKESQQCRELVKPLRKKAGGVEATGKPPERRKAGGQTPGLKYRRRKAGGQTSGQNAVGSPPLQGNKNSCDAYTGENDKSDPDHADQNPWGCFRQGSIPHTAGDYDRDDHHADGMTDGTHSCQNRRGHTIVCFFHTGHHSIGIRR